MDQPLGPPPMGPPMANVAGEPPNTTLWLVLSILATLLCCLPAGVVGIIYSAMAMSAVSSGDMEKARRNLGTAKTWTIVAAVVGIVFLLIYAVFVFIIGAAGAAGAGRGVP